MNRKAVELLNLIDSVTEEEAGAIAVLCKDTALHRAIKGINTSGIAAGIAEMADAEEKISLPRRTGDLLKRLGIPANLYGYVYLQTAVEAVVDDPDLIYAVTKELYPMVAEVRHTTASRVERAIRHSVEVAYARGDYALLAKIVPRPGANKGKATNSEFIAAVADYLRAQG